MNRKAATPLPQRFDLLLLASVSVAWWIDPSGLVTEPQASWEAYTGQAWATYRERGWLAAFHPEDRADLEATLRRALEDGTALAARGRLWSARAGRHRVVRINAVPARDDGGTIAEWRGAIVDIDDTVALADGEQRLRALVTATSWTTYRMSPDWREMWALDDGGFLAGTAAPTADWAERYIPEPERARVEAAIEAAVRERRVFDLEHRVRRADGSVGWTHSRAVPLLDGQGRIVEWLGAATDITARRDQEQALRDAHETFRLLLEVSPFGLYVVDDAMRIAHATRRTEEGAFRNVRPLVGRPLADVMHVLWSDDVAREIVGHFRHTLETGESYISPRFVHRRHDLDATESYEWELHRVRLPGGRWGVICHFFDSTELRTTEQALRRSEERARLLLREVNHRSKNLLSVVMTIARHTSEGNPGDFVERFDSRIRSLSINQDMLIRNDWSGVDLEELLRAHLQPFAEARDGRVTLAGPSLHLTSALATQSLGMAIHELATNAAKYGALSCPGGHVDLDWEIDGEAGAAPRLSMRWREVGGPAVEPPERKGFGTIVLTSMLQYSLGAEVDLSYRPDGLDWSLRCPLGRITQSVRPQATARTGRRRRVLVAEDEALLALEVKESLEAAGFEVIGPVSSADEALKLLGQGDCDMAVLDIRLEDGSSEPIARLLGERRKPFVVMSGYPLHHLPEVYSHGIARFAKPVPPSLLVRSLTRLDDEDLALS
ncbi:MAG: PAS domain-containing protein [Proteobacteria bacterium]|nr:PAS domain-containing protein [Pseudomonadota bacterium]